MNGVWRGILFAIRILLIGGSAVLVTLIGLNIPMGFWTSSSHLPFLVGALVVVFAAATAHEISDRFSHRGQTWERKIEPYLKIALVQASEATAIEVWHLGVHVHRVSRPLARPSTLELRRIAVYRLRETRMASGVRWTYGKGVIGSSWKYRTFLAWDATADVAAAAADPEGWNGRPGLARMEMTARDLRAASQFGTVAALPVYNSSEDAVVGVVSIDGPAGAQTALGRDAG